MRHVYQNPGEARAKGERASAEVLARWTWDHAASKIIARLDDIASQMQSTSRASTKHDPVTV
jgi:hypothetical protein